MTNEQHNHVFANFILVNVKLNALKLTLSDKDLNVYNDHVLDEVARFKPSLESLLTPEELETMLKTFLK